MQMQESNEIKGNFIFRLDEPHIVFVVLERIGKHVLGSSIDQMINEAGVYGTKLLVKFLKAST